MSEYVKFLADKELQKQLKNLQTFFGDSTREKLLRRVIPFAINKIAAQLPPPNLSREQVVAFQKLQKYHQEVCKNVGILWPSLRQHLEDDDEE